MASVNFLYRSTKEKSNLNLRLLYRYNSKDYVFGVKTKVEVSEYYWNKQHKKKSKDIDITNQQTEINNELNKIENHVLSSFNAVSIETINKAWLQTQIENYYNPIEDIHIPTNLIEYIDFYLDYRKNEITETNKSKCRVIKNKLIKYEAFLKKKILIKNINDSFKNEFVNYQKERMYSQNTIQREFVNIKTFCKHARYLGLETHPQLDSLRIDRQKVEKIYLTYEDLTKIENISKRQLTENLDNAKDWLVISCHTGQRVSDFMRFTDEQIRLEEGKPLIEFTQQKTGKVMTIPLPPKVIDILRTRNGKFPQKISDQKYNDAIKIVCKIAGLNQPSEGMRMQKDISGVLRKKSGIYKKYELVTSHIGRRSFATNFYGEIPTSFLIYMTGHSTEAMFLNYIGKSNKDIALEMAKYF